MLSESKRDGNSGKSSRWLYEVSNNLMYTVGLRGKYYPHFADEKVESLRGKLTLPRSRSRYVAEKENNLDFLTLNPV